MKAYIYLIMMGLFLFTFSGHSYSETLDGPKLRKVVVGKTIYLSLSMGVTLPIKYREGGTMYGKLKGFASLVPNGMPKKDSGRWWITKDRICQAWKNWLEKKSYCYSLKRINGQVYWNRNDGASGKARLSEH